jgi:hypothetical protein
MGFGNPRADLAGCGRVKLFEVIYWGKLLDADDHDTIYLVRAPDFQAAIDFVSMHCPREVHPRQVPHYMPDRVYELGVENSADEEVRILRGPYIEAAINFGGWQTWRREDEYDPASKWIEDSEARYQV